MSLLADLAEAPADLPTPSRFTALCGFFYAASGLVLLSWPGIVQTVFRDPAFVGREEALVRVIGMLIAIVGWFYFFGGRTGGRQFVAATSHRPIGSGACGADPHCRGGSVSARHADVCSA